MITVTLKAETDDPKVLDLVIERMEILVEQIRNLPAPANNKVKLDYKLVGNDSNPETSWATTTPEGNLWEGRMRQAQERVRMLGRSSSNRQEFRVDSRDEAEKVLKNLEGVITDYALVTVADAREFVGETPTFEDSKWGWRTLIAAQIRKVYGGYILWLPMPERFQHNN